MSSNKLNNLLKIFKSELHKLKILASEKIDFLINLMLSESLLGQIDSKVLL